MILTIIKKIKNARYQNRVIRAIKKADTLKALHKLKFMVIIFKGKPLVVSKKDAKHKIATGYFKKGTTIQDIERVAIYKTL